MTLRTWLFGEPVKHDWQLIDKTVLPSPFEQYTDQQDADWQAIGRKNSFWRKAVVLTWKCTLTGEVKVIKETNP